MGDSFQDYEADFPHKKSASKCCIREIIIDFPIYIQSV